MSRPQGARAATAWSKPRRLRVAPSLLSADFARIGEAIATVEGAGASFLHVDVMDGQFVPNLTFGPIIVDAIRRLATLPLDVHLMIVDPVRFLEPFALAGADHLILHTETVADPAAAARAIRSRGLRAGLTVKPSTSLDPLIEALPWIDIALVMTVEPGAGGQAFLPGSTERIARVREAIDRGGYDCLLEVDGGIAPDTAVMAARAGADSFVAGHSIFHDPDPAAALERLRAALDRS